MIPAYVLLSAKNASTAGIAARTLALAAESFARLRKLMYDGTAIASRMPMMMITTRSSMRVKPPSRSLRLILWFSLESMVLPSWFKVGGSRAVSAWPRLARMTRLGDQLPRLG